MTQAKPKILYIDTEFLREKTYFSKLCLVQVNEDGQEARYLDPLDERVDMQSVYEQLQDPSILKVLHSGKQDLEIFYHALGVVPSPIFDTQVAAALLGYGEQVSYAALVKKICDVELDKGHQFGDWSRRPLSDAQIQYALNDVVYLPAIYQALADQLTQQKREGWLQESQQGLMAPESYAINPNSAWERIKIRSNKSKDMVILQALAAWREERAVEKDLPRSFILKDETLAEIAMTKPKDAKALSRVRGLSDAQAKGWIGKAILGLMHEAMTKPREEWPKAPKKPSFSSDLDAALDMVRMLLKAKAAEAQIAPTLIATTDELKRFLINPDDVDHSLNKGWRYDIFGQYVKDLMCGKLVCTLHNGRVVFR